MKILGIDPGSRITGFGIIEANKLKFSYIEKNEVDIVVVERVFMRPDRPNPDAAIKLGHARGAIISAAGGKGIPIIDYTANQIKKAVVGRGHATKEQVSFMVQQLLKLNKAPQADAGDALAGAICHGYHAL